MRWGWLLALVLVLSACAGEPSPDAPPASAPGDQAPAPPPTGLGDPATAEACALIDRSALAGFGDVGAAEPTTFTACEASITRPDGTRLTVEVDFAASRPAALSPTAQGAQVRRRDGLVIVPEPGGPGGCRRHLVLDDRGPVVLVAVTGAPGRAGACEVADALADSVAGQLSSGRLPRRTDPPGSLAEVDPCAVLDPVPDPALEHEADGRRLTGGHACVWGDRRGRPGVGLTFHRSPPEPATLGPRDARPGVPAGCTRVRPAGSGEYVTVTVNGQRPPSASCALAAEYLAAVARNIGD